MEKWNYSLNYGNSLRSAIDDGDLMAVLNYLYKCYQELLDAGIIDEREFDMYTQDFDMYESEILEYGGIYEDADEDLLDNLDYELNEFYDMCDNLNVWIPLCKNLYEVI